LCPKDCGRVEAVHKINTVEILKKNKIQAHNRDEMA
jgi:hypothetical protein